MPFMANLFNTPGRDVPEMCFRPAQSLFCDPDLVETRLPNLHNVPFSGFVREHLHDVIYF